MRVWLKQISLIFLICFLPVLGFGQGTDFIRVPSSVNLFTQMESEQSNAESINLLMTPISTPSQYEKAVTGNSSVITTNSSFTDIVNSPGQVINNIIDNNVVKQIGVGVQVHF